MLDASRPHDLPSSPTAFIGRERETAQVKRELRSARLVTLIGLGGCAKTRLALQMAVDPLPEFRDGVWRCDLAAVTDPAYVARALSSVLHLAESPDRSALDSLTDALQARPAPLILDNCEHLLSACADLIHAVRGPAPACRCSPPACSRSVFRARLPGRRRPWHCPMPPARRLNTTRYAYL